MSGLLEASRWFVVITAQMVALFVVLSFLVGLLQAWIPEESLRSMFEKRSPVSAYLGGAALGAITPFCSFSTIPVLIGLLRSGAPFGPTMTFLFASPLLDPVILGVLAFVIGVEGAVLYAVVTFAAAIGMGVLLAKLGFESDVKEKMLPEGKSTEDGYSVEVSIWRKAWSGAWSFFVPVLPYLLVGTAIGAVVYGFVPTEWISSFAGPDRPLAIPAAAALGVPIYVNAETFFPITNALMDKGMGTGAMAALVITSMGVSLPEIFMLAGIFRGRLVVALVASVFATAIGGGALFALTLA
jgi:uncharacterized membrane protein YraQ (UPF0718 family)